MAPIHKRVSIVVFSNEVFKFQYQSWITDLIVPMKGGMSDKIVK